MVEINIKAIQSLFIGKCSIIEFLSVIDADTGFTDNTEVEVFKDIPCRLSFKNISSSQQTEITNNISQEIKLFVSPDVEIKEGSKVIVTQNGVTNVYCQSGVPSVYTSHREYILTLFKKEA